MHAWMLEKIPSLVPGAKICDSCRKELAQLEVESDPFNNSSNELDSTYICQQESLKSVNECLQAIGETPINKKVSVQKLSKRKVKENKSCSFKSHVTSYDVN